MVVVDFDGEAFVFNIEKVKFVPQDELAEKKVRKFKCTEQQHEFETEVVENATVICPIDASDKVQEVVDEVEEATETTADETSTAAGDSAEESVDEAPSANGTRPNRLPPGLP